MDTKEKELPELRIDTASHNNRCPDYDEDCDSVPDHLRCYLGFLHTPLGTAKGYCPFIHSSN